jgi:Fe-S-cluster-containing hydrogenase component 2
MQAVWKTCISKNAIMFLQQAIIVKERHCVHGFVCVRACVRASAWRSSKASPELSSRTQGARRSTGAAEDCQQQSEKSQQHHQVMLLATDGHVSTGASCN